MNNKSFFFISAIGMIASPLLSQNTANKDDYSVKKEINNNIELTAGLGYFSDPSENLFDVYHFGNFPDSIYLYYNNGDITDMIISEKSYYTVESKTVTTRIDNNLQDLYYYNETGLLDSAILESEADREYDDYAIKHVYTYNGGLIETEVVSVDNIDDSVNDDWNTTQETKFTYDASQRVKVKVIEHLTWQADVHFEKNVCYYNESSAKGITQTDTNFVVNTIGEKIAKQIVIKKYNSADLCTEEKYFQFGAAYLLKPDSFGTPIYEKEIVKEYDNNKNLLSEEINYNYNAQPSGYKNIYEYNTNGSRKLKTVYYEFNNDWYLTNLYQYYYKLSSTDIVNIGTTELHVFPNPVYDILNVKGLPIGSDIIIYSADGKTILKQKLTSSPISVSGLSKGIYIIKVLDSEYNTFSGQIIKE